MHAFDFLLPSESFEHNLETVIQPALAPICSDAPFVAEDGAQMYGRIYATPNAHGVIVICHGFCEYADKYLEVIYNFVQLGYAVALCEHRGHGFSARLTANPHAVHLLDFNTYVRDFNVFTQQVSVHFPQLPLYLFGHSMGGCIAARYLELHPSHYHTAILTSPMLEIHPSGLPMWLASLYCKAMLWCGKGEATQRKGDFCRTSDFAHSSCLCQERFEALFKQRLAEPHYQTAHGTIGWLNANLKGIRQTQRDASAIHIPLLLCQAGNDQLVFPRGHARFLQHIGNGTMKQFPDSKHEIFSATAPTRLSFWQTVAAFLRANEPI